MFWFFFPIIVCLLTVIIVAGKFRTNYIKTVLTICLISVLAYVTSFGSAFSSDSSNNIIRYGQYTTFSSLFFSSSDIGVSRDAEVGYNFLCYLGNVLHLGGPGFFFVLSFIINLIFVKTIRRFPNPIVSILVYICSIVYIQQTNLLRQSLAVSLFVLILYFIDNKKQIYVICLFALSILIHTTSIITIPFVLMCFFDYSKYIKVLKNVLAVVWIFSILDVLGVMRTSWTSSLLLYYLSQSSYGDTYDITDTLGTSSHFDILGNILFLFLLFFYKSEKHVIYVIVAMSACILSNFAFNLPLLNRLVLFYMAIYCCIWGLAMSQNVLIGSGKKSNIVLAQNAQLVVLMLCMSYVVLKVIIYDNIICHVSFLGTDFYPLSKFFK